MFEMWLLWLTCFQGLWLADFAPQKFTDFFPRHLQTKSLGNVWSTPPNFGQPPACPSIHVFLYEYVLSSVERKSWKNHRQRLWKENLNKSAQIQYTYLDMSNTSFSWNICGSRNHLNNEHENNKQHHTKHPKKKQLIYAQTLVLVLKTLGAKKTAE